VRLLWAHLGIAHRRVEVNQVTGGPRTPEFRALNPIGKVPAVRLDDGRILSESGAILFYFAQGTRFWPAGAWTQAQVLRWMFFEQYSHEPYIAVNRYILRFIDDRRGLDDRIEENHAKGVHALAVMEQRLAGAPWLAGNAYSIADIALYAYTHNAHEGGFDLNPYPGIRHWLERIAAEPGYIAQMRETSAEPVVPLVP
jgi:glutathione S-transferase